MSTLTQLTELTSLTDDDILYVVDNPLGTPASRYVKWSTIRQSTRVVQVVNTETGAVATGTTTIPTDDTIPQIGEGTEFMTLAITPISATNKLKIDVVFIGASGTASRDLCVALFQDATANALACTDCTILASAANAINTIVFSHSMTAGTTSATTFRVRAGVGTSGTVTFNGSAAARFYGGVFASSITITETTP